MQVFLFYKFILCHALQKIINEKVEELINL
ncbi:hypothetical protein XBKQ1_2150058 [Xenorhabdus bovienii str. kraussei Quebec]|uniref:Uncharacterized protein n=4 Tax=Xenorhabdus bovienii TaxID=40576 RepID=A0A077PFW9_XENBV|nr:hypothetical protein XBFFR1_2300024 [Xenorhabdus bovienii str. feltiae France]CDG97680.1 hypothetical protein XBP1_2720030 [Xenorhabdus bovienii str. puntauvense]CDH19517.1 hypothetical protein XBKQ1_2150058 [Xenorhabdus bovienii str. kraussei Quebec]CDH33472.1 hypothetical protein XBI1_2660032 [Xenorhabdus bovienii str. Intermedium]CDM89591.1 protein of unknown function [Xenorhabdus bovienii]